MNSPDALRLGTRASPLARWQADWVAAQLAGRGLEVALVPISTRGDQQRAGPIGTIGAQGVFTKEIQRALLAGDIDLAVHSLKDLPTELVSGLVLAAVPQRGSPGDVLVSREAGSVEGLRLRAVVGTGSLRRRAQLWHLRPDLEMRDIRGNVETRLAKLDRGEYDALVLAEAGLERLGLAERITCTLPRSLMLPAVGQGALAIEAREGDRRTLECLAALDDAETRAAVVAERAMLSALRGGCLAPVGAWGHMENGELRLSAVVLAADGSKKLSASAAGQAAEALELGRRVAGALLEQGAAELIQAARARIKDEEEGWKVEREV